MELSRRLYAVASLVTEGASVADVGTDHGYIPIYLMQKNIASKVIALDINGGPLERARMHIIGYNLKGQIETRLSDGLSAVQPGEVDTMIAAGMGGGPVMGFAVGFLGDMLNCLVRGFAYFPGFSLSYALVGALCGLILYKSRVTKLRAAGCAFVEYLISITLTSTWLYLMYGTPLQVLFTSRLIKCTLNFFVNIVIVYIFIEAFQRIIRAALPAHR